MTNGAPQPGWWQASDGNWYPPSDAPAPPTWGPGATYPTPVYGPPRRTNTNAIISLVLGILGIAGSCGCLTGIPAIFLGRTAKREIEASDGLETGGGLATAGVVLGIISTVLMLLGIAWFVAAIWLFSSTDSSDNDFIPPPQPAPTISVPR